VPQEEVASADAAPRPPLDASALPPDDGGFLLRTKLLHDFHQLDGKDREDALKELAELARWGDKEALALITESLSDPSSDVRARALRELDEVDRQNLAAHLERMIADTSGKVREIVADRLSKLPESEAGPMLLGLLRDRDKDVVMAAIRSIDDLNYAAARPLLTQQLGAENLDVATRAALTLRKLGDDGATAAMIERVVRDFSAGDVSTRIDNVKRLRRLHAQVQLTGILDSDPSLAVREAAREALAKLED
jgi:HEAT repeat protein